MFVDNSTPAISASCLISNQMVSKNGEALLLNPSIDNSSFLLSIYQHFELNYSKFYKMDNLCKLGWLASEILLNGSFIKQNYRPEDVGIVLLNANSSLDSDIRYHASVNDIPSPALFVYTLPNIIIGEICIRNNFTGEDAFFVNEKFDPIFIHNYVSMLLNTNLIKCCICGWVELVGDEYKACLFLVDKIINKENIPFTIPNINKIFNQNVIEAT